ncbi:MAG: tape measure protein [Bryobacterales bacterium]|nr:tape measure protein [Bryobacterales bacterium]
MADLKTSIVIRAVDKLTAPIKRINAANGRLRDRLGAVTAAANGAGRATGKLAERQRNLRKRIGASTEGVTRQTRALRGLSGAFGGAAMASRNLGLLAGGIAYGFKRTFIDTAASFERFETVLKTIEGSGEKARQSMDWISNFAVTTPFELDQVSDAFVKLRAYGLDPTDGLLRDLGDASAAMGKPLMQAVETIADAVTGENERLKEFGIKARAVEGGRFRYEYTVDGETRFAEAMADDRAGIERTLREIFADRGFTGSMEEQSKTFSGLVSNLMDQWTRFQQMVMKSGAFEYLKDRLGALLDKINEMAADGSLQEFAERIGRGLVGAFQWAEQTIKDLWPWVLRIGEALAWAADKLGGWGNLALTLSGLYIAKPFIGLAGSLKGMFEWSGKALGGIRKVAGAAAQAAPGGVRALAGVAGGLFPAKAAAAAGSAASGGGLLAGLMGKLAGFGGVVKGIAVALGLLTIKFWLVVAVAAAVVAAIYRYWEPLKAFLGGVWEGPKEGLQPLLAALEPVVAWFRELLTPVRTSQEELAGIAAVGKMVGKVLGTALGWLIGWPLQLKEAWSGAAGIGAALVDVIGKGIRGAAARMLGPLKWVLDKAKALLPSSDALTGPLSNLTGAGASILDTMGRGVLRAGPGGLMRPLSQTLAHAAAGGFSSEALGQSAPAPLPGFPSRAASPSGAASFPSRIDNSIHIQQLTVHQQPGEDAGELAERLLREIEYRWQVRRRSALYDDL